MCVFSFFFECLHFVFSLTFDYQHVRLSTVRAAFALQKGAKTMEVLILWGACHNAQCHGAYF